MLLAQLTSMTTATVASTHLRVLLLLPESRSLRTAASLPVVLQAVIGSIVVVILHRVPAPLRCRDATIAAGSRCTGVAALSRRSVRRCVLCCREADVRV